MKVGRPLLLGNELDAKVIDRIKSVRQSGGIIDRHVVQCIGRAIVSVKEPLSLVENGGNIALTEGWAKSLLHRIGFTKRNATTGKLPLPDG